MAKKKKESRRARNRSRYPRKLLALQRPLFIGLTAIAFFSGLIILYQAWQAWESNRAGPALIALRETISEQNSSRYRRTQENAWQQSANDAYLRADFCGRWPWNRLPNASSASGPMRLQTSVYSAQLAEVYKLDLRQFRLYPVGADQPCAGIPGARPPPPIGLGARGNLGVAASVRDAGKAVGVVLVRVPTESLSAAC
jgi:hypothetical protein